MRGALQSRLVGLEFRAKPQNYASDERYVWDRRKQTPALVENPRLVLRSGFGGLGRFNSTAVRSPEPYSAKLPASRAPNRNRRRHSLGPWFGRLCFALHRTHRQLGRQGGRDFRLIEGPRPGHGKSDAPALDLHGGVLERAGTQRACGPRKRDPRGVEREWMLSLWLLTRGASTS